MQKLLPYLYIAPAFIVTIVFSFVSMGISLWASFYHYDAFAGAVRGAGAAPAGSAAPRPPYTAATRASSASLACGISWSPCAI